MPERDLQPSRFGRRALNENGAVAGAAKALTGPPATVHPDKRGTEHLANERTFLAWIRTSVSIISLGFVVDRFGLFLRELGNAAGARHRISPAVSSLVVGDVMMGIGAAFAALAAFRYHVVSHDIERGVTRADRGTVAGIALVVVLLAAAMMVIARP